MQRHARIVRSHRQEADALQLCMPHLWLQYVVNQCLVLLCIVGSQPLDLLLHTFLRCSSCFRAGCRLQPKQPGSTRMPRASAKLCLVLHSTYASATSHLAWLPLHWALPVPCSCADYLATHSNHLFGSCSCKAHQCSNGVILTARLIKVAHEQANWACACDKT